MEQEELQSVGFADPARAFANLRKLEQDPSSGLLFRQIRPHLLSALANCPDPDMALNNLEVYAGKVLDPRFFFSLLRDNPRVLDLIVAIFSHSQFLSDILFRHPQYLYWLLEPGQLRKAKLKEEMAEELSLELVARASREEKIRALRRFNRREILRIGVADILDNLDLVDVTQQLSFLAEITLQAALDANEGYLVERHGRPHCLAPDGGQSPCSFTILGLGKLGGAELNFSSDIDIMYLYTAPGETVPTRPNASRIENHLFYVRLAESINRAIAEPSEEGHCFRIDLRLRPGGQSGSLALPLRAYESYYESQGQTWERQALIKARPVAGDQSLGKEFLRLLTPFVYRQYLDYQAISEIKAMKEKIDLSHSLDPGTENDVKLGRGGIREIEFIVQAFQLIHGGQNPWIREPNTLRALHLLAEQRLLPLEEYSQLVKAYTFLRRVEHRLQLLHQIRTHRLPTRELELTKLAKRLGYHPRLTCTPREDFLRDFREHTAAVRSIYDRLFHRQIMVPAPGSGPDLSLLLEDPEGAALVRKKLAEARIRDVERGYRNLLLLKEGGREADFTLSESPHLRRLLPLLLEALKLAPDPDMALNSFEQFVRAMGARDSLYSLLAENPSSLDILVQLFGHSESLAQLLILHPDLLSTLLYPPALRRRHSRAEMAEELSSLLRQAPNAASRLDALRHFKKSQELRIGIREIREEVDIASTLEDLTRVAEVCLEAALRIAREELESRLPLSPKEGQGWDQPPSLAVIGLGKLGGAELNLGSDLDILFVYDQGREDPIPSLAEGSLVPGISRHAYCSRLAHRILHLLTAFTKEGSAYRVDARLRPGGQKGEIAQSLASYLLHFEKMAELWERQALVKARFICGDPGLGADFVRSVHQFVYGRGLSRQEIEQMAEMRERMGRERGGYDPNSRNIKLGEGGIVEIEFVVQMLQLRYGGQIEPLRTSNTLEALKALASHGLLAKEEAEPLRDSYLFLRRLENRLRMLSEQASDSLPSSPSKLESLALRMGYPSSSGKEARGALLADLDRHRATVRRLYQEIFRRESSPEGFLSAANTV